MNLPPIHYLQISRRWPRFSIKAMLLLIVIAAAVCWAVKRQHQAQYVTIYELVREFNRQVVANSQGTMAPLTVQDVENGLRSGSFVAMQTAAPGAGGISSVTVPGTELLKYTPLRGSKIYAIWHSEFGQTAEVTPAEFPDLTGLDWGHGDPETGFKTETLRLRAMQREAVIASTSARVEIRLRCQFDLDGHGLSTVNVLVRTAPSNRTPPWKLPVPDK